MTNKELQELLQLYPDDLKVWIDEGMYSEGGRPFRTVDKTLASEAGLDGDLISDEYFYVKDEDEEYDEVEKQQIASGEYYLNEDGDVYSKYILLFKLL